MIALWMEHYFIQPTLTLHTVYNITDNFEVAFYKKNHHASTAYE